MYPGVVGQGVPGWCRRSTLPCVHPPGYPAQCTPPPAPGYPAQSTPPYTGPATLPRVLLPTPGQATLPRVLLVFAGRGILVILLAGRGISPLLSLLLSLSLTRLQAARNLTLRARLSPARGRNPGLFWFNPGPIPRRRAAGRPDSGQNPQKCVKVRKSDDSGHLLLARESLV